jgi:probable poly-beta-1,6-N-acetyl-D-glucosamine export protein
MVRRLLYLMGLAVLCVVLYHASGWGFIAMFWWTDRYLPVTVPNFDQMGSSSYCVLRVIEQLVIFAIPCFLFVSGFFLAFVTGRDRTKISWGIIITRVKNLFVPYLIWSSILIGLEVLLGRRLSVDEFIRIILTGQATDAYYFIPVLIQLYLLAPFLIPWARDRWKLVLFLTGVFQIFILCLQYLMILGFEAPALQPFYILTRTWLFTGFLFWFALGIVFGFHSSEIKPLFIRLRWPLLLALILVFLLGIFEWEVLLRASGKAWIAPKETLIDQFYAGLFLITFLGFERTALPGLKTISQIGTKSFGVYLVHSLALIYTSKLIYHFIPGILGVQWIFQPILYVAGLGIPLLLMEIIARTPARRFYSLLFG